jgi:AraC-like DNA-binding protein
MIFIEPESRLGTVVLRDLEGRDFARPDPEVLADIAARLTCIWEEPRPEDATLAELGRALAMRFADKDASEHPVDKRIARVLEQLAIDLETPLSASEAAGIACLSESRFSHLFVEEVGLPFRTYVLWRRLMIAVNEIAAGTNLTSAAHKAGFADSAHFSRTFLRMFGVPASLLLMI